MSKVTFERRASVDELAKEMDRRGLVIETLEARATAAEATVTALQEALEKIARGTSLVFTSNPQTMNGREAIDIARAALSQIRSEK